MNDHNTSSVRKDEPLDLIELVAIPANDKVQIAPFESIKFTKDRYGFQHMFVPEEKAKAFLYPSGGLRWEIVSGCDRLEIKILRGMHMRPEIKVRHHIVPNGKEGMTWKPIADR